MRIEYLDRVFAHTACVHDLAWLPPSKDDTCAGYLASGSFDHTVKVWQIDLARLSTKPLHTLHAPYPIGKLGWRPGPQFATEVVVLPYHSGGGGSQRMSNGAGTAEQSAPDSLEKFAPRVWDIRKGWVAKWALDAADGPATGEQSLVRWISSGHPISALETIVILIEF
jgi:WD40 repeat protein